MIARDLARPPRFNGDASGAVTAAVAGEPPAAPSRLVHYLTAVAAGVTVVLISRWLDKRR